MNCLVMVMLSATLASGNAEFDDSARKGAAEIATARLAAHLRAEGPPSGVLERTMLSGGERYSSHDGARRLCRKVYEDEIGRCFAAGVEEIRRELKLGDGFAPVLSERDREAAMKLYDAVYERERQSACAVQAASIAGGIRPSESEFETVPESRLKANLVARIVSGHRGAVFDENRQYISTSIVERVFESARREVRRQREYLLRFRCDSFSPAEAASQIETGLRDNVAERLRKGGDPATNWGVFPRNLEKSLAEAVERRMLERVAGKVGSVKVDVSEEALRKAISADPVAHRSPEGSEAIFRKQFRSRLEDGAVATAAVEAPEACREEFGRYVNGHLAGKALADAVKSRIDRELVPLWKQSRSSVAERDLVRIWPMLADGTWYPGGELADRFAASSDYARTVGGWRMEADMRNLAERAGKGAVLAETDARADELVRRAFDLARNAINAQRAIVDAERPSVLADAQERKRSFWRMTPNRRNIASMLLANVERRWEEERLQVLWKGSGLPANAERQHVEIFPSVRKYIEMVAGEISEQLDDPEEGSYTIVIKRHGKRVDVRLQQGGRTVISREAEAEMSEYRKAVRRVSDHLATQVLGISDPQPPIPNPRNP